MQNVRQVNSEVFVAERPIVQVDREQMNFLLAQAQANPRQRARLCAHKDAGDRLHEMLIVLTRAVYIRPHKHLQKSESFHVIYGSAIVVFFDDDGRIEELIEVGEAASGKAFYFRNDDCRYHTQIIVSDHLVFHETTNGPFNRADTIFAPWAPEETDTAAVQVFLEKLKNELAAKQTAASDRKGRV
jgi:cupin fold WbuC family metalloprotein